MMILRRSLVVGRTFASAAAANKQQARIELQSPALDVFKERLTNLGLLQNKLNVDLRLDGSAVVIEGEEAAIKQASSVLAPLKDAKDEAEVVKILTSLLGEGKKFRLPNKILDRKSAAFGLLPALGEQTWIYRSSQDSAAYLWSDSTAQAEKDVEKLTKWVNLVREFQTARSHPTAEVEYHPSFTWLSRPEFQRLQIPGVLLDKSKTKARVWALEPSAVENAKAFLSKPYRPVDAKDIQATLSIAPSAQSVDLIYRLCKLDQVAKTLEARGNDTGFKVDEATPNSVKFSSHWSTGTLMRAFTLALAEDIKSARLSVGTISATPEGFARGLESVRAHLTPDSIAVAQGELKVEGRDPIIIAWICATNNQVLNAAKLFFDAKPSLVKLRLDGFKDCHFAVNNNALGKISSDLLGWDPKQRSLTHWGLDWFSVELADGENDASAIEKQFSTLAAAPFELSPKQSLKDEAGRVVIVRLDTNEKGAKTQNVMIVAKDRATLDQVLASAAAVAPKEKPAKKEKEASSNIKVTRIEPEKPAKTTRISAPKHMEKADKTTRIEVPPEEPVAVTRIQAPKSKDEPAKTTRIIAPSMDDAPVDEEALEGDADRRPSPHHQRGSKRRTPRGYNVSKELVIKEQYVGSVIGRHGMTMRGVETKTKTAISVEEHPEEEGAFRVVISGSTQAHVDLAAAELEGIIEQVQITEKQKEATGEGRRSATAGRRRGRRMRDDGTSDGQEEERDTGRLKLKLFSPTYREKIWETYKSDPARWTDEEVCKHFSISQPHWVAIRALMQHREEYLEKNKDDEVLCSKDLEKAVVAKVGETLDEIGEDPKPPVNFKRPAYVFLDPAAPQAGEEAKKESQPVELLPSKAERPKTVQVFQSKGFKVTIQPSKMFSSSA